MSNKVRLVEKKAIADKRLRSDVALRLQPTIRYTVNCLNHKYNSALYEPNDFIQEIWIKLVSNDFRLLRQYDATRCKSLNSYIKMITERKMLDILRKEHAVKRGYHFTVELDDSEGESPYSITFDTKLEASIFAQKLYHWLCDRLSDVGVKVLNAIYYGDAPSDAAVRLGMTPQAVYNWQHKIRLMSRKFLSQDNQRSR